MAFISNNVIDLLDASMGHATAAKTGAAFLSKLGVFGARAIYARAFGTQGEEPSDEQVLARISPTGWESIYAERDFASVNYLPREVRRRAKPFAWSDIKLNTKAERDLMKTLGDCGFPNGLATPCHGPNGYHGVISLAFERFEAIPPADRAAIEFASLVIHDRMRSLAFKPFETTHPLTVRELECLRFVADGWSDGEIGDRLSVADSTVSSHIKSVRANLGSRTRAQAVAQGLLKGIL